MASAQPTYTEYLKEAFHRRLPVKGLGHIPVNYLGLAAFAVLGIANPGFWLLGGALELGYLTWMSSNPRFQKLIRGERMQAVNEDMSNIRLAQSVPAQRPQFSFRLPAWKWSLHRANKGDTHVNTGDTVLALDQKCADGPTPA